MFAHLLKHLTIRTTFVALMALCALPDARAAVMAFPDESFSSSASAAIGLDRSGEEIDDLGLGSGGDQASDHELRPDLLLDTDTDTDTSNDDIVNSVLGVSRSENWMDETRNIELAEPINALTLMKAYVNILNNSNAPPSTGIGGQTSSGNAPGFMMSLARSIDDEDTLNFITQVMRPQVEDNLVTFSVLGFGQFMVVGEPDSGSLTIMDLANGHNLAVRKSDPGPYPNGRLSAEETVQNSDQFLPNEGEALAQILIMLAAIVMNPLFIFSAGCIFFVWLVYRLAKRFS